MSKTYQPFIVKLSEELIEILDKQVNFFQEENITSTDYAKMAICELLTEKFLRGEISSDEEEGLRFTEDEFKTLLSQIVTNNALSGLVEKGLINFLENEDGEEMFFLTSKGKEYAETLQKKDEEINKNKSEENE
jgi:predicted transcriptional regulator